MKKGPNIIYFHFANL